MCTRNQESGHENQESGHEGAETLPCIKRLPIRRSYEQIGAQSRVQEGADLSLAILRTATATTVTCVNSFGASRAKPPNHSSVLARAPRPD